MDVKQAVKTALEYVATVFESEELSNLGLEEVTYDDIERSWNVTVGFSRPWDIPRPGIFAGIQTASPLPRREYKVVKIKEDGSVKSITIREQD